MHGGTRRQRASRVASPRDRMQSSKVNADHKKRLACWAKMLLIVALLVAPSPAFLQSVAPKPERAFPASSFSNEDSGDGAYLHPVATLNAKQAELFALGH